MAALNLSFPSVKWETQWGPAGSGTVVRGRALRQPAWVLGLAPASQGPGQGPSPRGSVCSCQVGVIMLGGLGESRSGPVTSTRLSTRICSSGNASCRCHGSTEGRRECPPPAALQERPRTRAPLSPPQPRTENRCGAQPCLQRWRHLREMAPELLPLCLWPLSLPSLGHFSPERWTAGGENEMTQL